MIRLAVLGCGKIARAHAKRLRRHKHQVSLAFSSRDRAKAEAYAHELGGRALGDYASAIADPDLDAVMIATPPHLHLDLTLGALAAGKHVMVEKPAFPRAADFAVVEAAAAAAGKRVFVAENYFYKPSLARVRGLITSGLIGDVLFVHVNAIKRQTTSGWRDDETLALGGALYEGGVHWVDFMANLGLTVTRVRGAAPAPPTPGAIERSMLVMFEYAEGAVGTLSYSWEVPATAKGLRLSKIYGRAGTITFETNGLWVVLHGKKTRIYVPGLRDLAGYRRMFADFVRAWTTDSDAELTLARARRDYELVEQAYRTASNE